MLATVAFRRVAPAVLVGLLAALPLVSLPARAADPFPFVIPWDDSSPTAVDVSFLNDGPAGSHGRIVVRGGHFVESGTGQRVRFLAVNLAASSAFPEHADAEKLAARLAKYGVNLVRLHHMDNSWDQPSSLIDFGFPDRQHLNPTQLDHLDYLIAQLKKHGIYSNINLHVSRTVTPADGFPASVSSLKFDFDKRVDYFDPRIIELQKKYAHDLLTHVNPYTKMAYTDEPAVLNVELTNEDSLLGDPWSGLGSGLTNLPEPFNSELQGLWNQWLTKKYHSAPALNTAWTKGTQGVGPEMLQPTPQPGSWTLEHQGTTTAALETGSTAVTEGMNLLTDPSDMANWAMEQSSANAAATLEPDAGALKATVTKVDGTDWHVQMRQAGLNLEQGKTYTLTFRARADQPRAIGAAASADGPDWHNVGLTGSADLTQEWQTFRFPFTATKVVPNQSRLLFVLGQQTGVVWLSDISLKQDLPAPQPGAADAPALKVTVGAVDGTGWHVQLHQTGLDLKNGETYSVRFRARADSPWNVGVYTGLDEADWRHVGLDTTVDLDGSWKTYQFAFTAHDAVPGHTRLSFSLGTQTGSVWLADVELRQGFIEPPVKAGQSPTSNTVPIPLTPFGQQETDWLTFLADTETAYATGMENYLKKDLHLKSLVICSQVSYGGLAGARREMPMDFIDNHAYWQHPSFPHKPWDPVDWRIGNTSMVPVLGSGDTLSGLARDRIWGKPYTVSEYNHPAPNEYQAEMMPLFASFAAYQDWDAIYLFDYGSYGAHEDTNRIQGFFAVGSNPAKWAFMPAVAMIFRGAEIQPAWLSAPVPLPQPLVITPSSSAATVFRAAGRENISPFAVRTGLTPVPIPAASMAPAPAGYTTLQVYKDDPKKAFYTASAPDARVVVGFVGGSTVRAGDASFEFGECPNNFAALTITTQDDQPLASSARMLLTVADRVENTGMTWNAEHNSVGQNWGKAPSVADGVPVRVTLAASGPRRVYALDGTGKTKKEVPAEYRGGKLQFSVGPADETLWYAVTK